MTIVIINGPAKSGKSLIATALRNDAINYKRGALLVDEQTQGEIAPLLEKLLIGVNVPAEPPEDLGDLPWKDDPMVILVGDRAAILDDFEAALPGFAAFLGPVYTVATGIAK